MSLSSFQTLTHHPIKAGLFIIFAIYLDRTISLPIQLKSAARIWARKNGLDLLADQTDWKVGWTGFPFRTFNLKISVKDAANEIHTGLATFRPRFRFSMHLSEVKWDGTTEPQRKVI